MAAPPALRPRRRVHRAAAIALGLLAALAPAAGAEPAPIAAARWPVVEPVRARAMLDRLRGHRVRWQDGVLAIDRLEPEARKAVLREYRLRETLVASAGAADGAAHH